jgi:hypothetical protein
MGTTRVARAGAVLIASVLTATRSPSGRALLAAGWGFACGIMYRTTFEQLAESSGAATPSPVG